MNEIVWFIIFFTPAYVANMLPPFFRKLPFGYPLDCNIKLRNRPLLGKNKTWRGLIVGTLGGGVVGAALQASGLAFFWWWGLVLGFAALLGDALKSIVKRQLDIKPGARWMPWDQLDFIIVAYLFSLVLAGKIFSWKTVLVGFAIIFVANIIVQTIGGKTGVKADSL